MKKLVVFLLLRVDFRRWQNRDHHEIRRRQTRRQKLQTLKTKTGTLHSQV